MLNIYNNVFTQEKNLELYKFLLFGNNFSYGEVDNIGGKPTGMVFDLDSNFTKIFVDVIEANCPDITKLNLQRAYVNLFLPNELPYFHTDGNVITCLFYITPDYDLDEGGETQFHIDDNIIGIRPRPGRLVVFDGNILHRATSYRSNPRITVAVKFIPE